MIMYQRLLLLSSRLHNINVDMVGFVLDERWHGNYVPSHSFKKRILHVVGCVCVRILNVNKIFIIHIESVPHAYQLIMNLRRFTQMRNRIHLPHISWKDQHPLYRCPICTSYTYTLYVYTHDTFMAAAFIPFYSILNTHNKSNNWIKTAHATQ